MTFFTASIGTIALRFYLMMGIIMGAFFSGFYGLALLALPVFLSALVGVSFTSTKTKTETLSVANRRKNKVNTAA